MSTTNSFPPTAAAQNATQPMAPNLRQYMAALMVRLNGLEVVAEDLVNRLHGPRWRNRCSDVIRMDSRWGPA